MACSTFIVSHFFDDNNIGLQIGFEVVNLLLGAKKFMLIPVLIFY